MNWLNGRFFKTKLWSLSVVYNLPLIALFLFASTLSFSQYQNFKFGHLGTAQGLSNSNVYCILQDNHGFLWFGTRDGLNKYDGYSFTVYKNNPADKNSLSNNRINGMVEDADGMLWLATWGGGGQSV